MTRQHTSEDAAPPEERLQPRDWLPALVVTLVVRLPFLLAARGASFAGDEPNYVRLGRAWADHGAYAGQWPPGQAGFIALFARIFGEHGPFAARSALTLLSLWTCAWLVVIARDAYGRRAARLTGWLYAFSLPLVPFAHLLLSEGLYLAVLVPAVVLLLRGIRSASPWPLTAAGALLGLSCLVRESSFLLVLAVLPWVLVASRTEARLGWRRMGLVLAAAAAVVTPWTARNAHVYDRVVPLATTSGSNAFLGWDAYYVNFDLLRLDVAQSGIPGAALRSQLLADPPPPMRRSWAPNMAQRDSENLRTALAFAREHPGYVARTRLVKAADFATPLSYLGKYLRLGTYADPFRPGLLAGLLTLFTALWVPFVALSALVGWLAAPAAPSVRSLTLVLVLAFTAPAAAVAMSRFRVPLDALALVPAAGALVARPLTWKPAALALAGLAVMVLTFCWLLSLAPVVAATRAAFG